MATQPSLQRLPVVYPLPEPIMQFPVLRPVPTPQTTQALPQMASYTLPYPLSHYQQTAGTITVTTTTTTYTPTQPVP